jgi:hypothetical protein
MPQTPIFNLIATPGPAGPGYLATSASSLATVGTGSVSFATQTGLAYAVGDRIQATSRGTAEWMQGVVTSYSGTAMIATMDKNSGTGTHADWNIGLAGLKGDTGAAGANGTNGTNGTNGADGSTWYTGSGAPASGLGVVNDLYFDNSGNGNWYKKTGASTWTLQGSVLGPQGIGYNPRGAYAAGTTYAQGDMVSYSSANYLSLAGSNTGNTPSSSPTWWQSMAASGLADPGSNGVLKRTALNTTGIAAGADLPVMTASGTGHHGGAAPDPGASAGTAKYLREDATFAVPPGGAADIVCVIDGGGAVISTGVKGDIKIDFACTITAWSILADQSGSCVVNIWKVAQASYPATVSNKITASAPPTISTATNATNSTLTGWTTAISAGDCLRFNVDSATTVTRVTLILAVTKS